MKTMLMIVSVAGFALAACNIPSAVTPPKAALEAAWKPAPGQSFEWQLPRPLDLNVQADVFDVDLFTTSGQEVSQLHQQGRKAVCYINVGAWQPGQPDDAQFQDAWKGKPFDVAEFSEERYLDIRQPGVREIMRARIQTCKGKGFDAVEPDNMDAYLSDTGFPLTPEDAVDYALFLAQAAHSEGLAILQKNAQNLTSQLIGGFDGALLESCSGLNFCDGFLSYIDAGKAVFDVEYVDGSSEGNLTEAQFQDFCANQAYQSFTRILKYRDLRAGLISSCS